MANKNGWQGWNHFLGIPPQTQETVVTHKNKSVVYKNILNILANGSTTLTKKESGTILNIRTSVTDYEYNFTGDLEKSILPIKRDKIINNRYHADKHQLEKILKTELRSIKIEKLKTL